MGRRGRLRLGSSPRRASSNPLTRSLDWAPVAPRFPSSWLQPLPHPWKPRCGCQFAAAGGAAGQRVGGLPPISVLLQTRPCPGSHLTPREASGPATHEGKPPDYPNTPGFASRGPGNSRDCNQYLGHPSSGLLVQMPTFQDCPEP